MLDALTANPDVWARTVLFLNFDENDGFFDHVTPPQPPALNPDGSRAGGSTVDYRDDIHSDGLAYGLSVRVPMTVVSPWSTGGWVNSQVFDHTSVIRFLEKRFGVIEPNITAWRRAVSGDLTSAFDFSKPAPGKPVLPNTSDAIARVEAALRLPKPVPPTQGQDLYQEPGMRPSRALPYVPRIEEHLSVDSLQLTFANDGAATVVYQVHDLTALDLPPRHYTVEPGKTLREVWPVISDYHLQVRGSNRWFREYAGSKRDAAAVKVQERGIELLVELSNRGTVVAAMRCRDGLAGSDAAMMTLAPGTQRKWRLPLSGKTGFWYDVTIDRDDGSSFLRRMAGRLETGRASTSKPV